MKKNFRRPLLSERYYLKNPMNDVTFSVKIEGIITQEQLRVALKKVRRKHPLLGCRVSIDGDGIAEFIQDDDIEFPIETYSRDSEDFWIEYVKKTSKISFNVEKGPLIRLGLISDDQITDLVIYCHHIFSDGLSVKFLCKHLLEFIENPNKSIEPIRNLPLLVFENLRSKTKPNFFLHLIFSWLNKKWKRNPHVFTEDEFQNRFKMFWKDKNRGILIHHVSADISDRFFKKCKEVGVTVNSAFFCIMVSAYNRILNHNSLNKMKITLAIDLRDKLIESVGEAFGLYAGVFTLDIKLDSSIEFWELAKYIHKKIYTEYSDKKIFRGFNINFLDPNLFDSLHFQDMDIDNKASEKLSNFIGIYKPRDGVVITNLKNIDIPEKYGNMKIKGIRFLPPCVPMYKFITGLWTHSGILGYSLVYYEPNISPGTMALIADEINKIIETS